MTSAAPISIESEELTSLQSYLLAEQARHPNATGRPTWILSAISLSTTVIADEVLELIG